MSAFDQLDPLVQHHVVNTLGWRELRPLQEQSIAPIQAGHHCLLLAATAAGKTEAAMFPVLSRICSENWAGLSVIYVCPLKALLNNLHVRLDGYCRMLGRRCEVWHGDISPSVKNRIKADPPDILLTTPESLEVMMISTDPAGREILKGTRIVVIDEIHAFAGDDRGWHLLAVLERIGKLAGRELQRIGLSATVGNPAELLTWLAGHCSGARQVIQPDVSASKTETCIELDYVGSLKNAAIVICRLHRGEKRLVFCDSRGRVEELGNELRELGVTVFLSHSSLSAEERRVSEQAFAAAHDCVIVSTSTLELGIDVGNLDRVIQIDAPHTVASFLQRLGRTGRRSGSVRNCLFLATNENALLKAAALIELWGTGFIEPVSPPTRPMHLFAQQLMALALQEKGIGINDWFAWLGRLPPFANENRELLNSIVSFLLEKKILFSDGVRLSFGDAGQSLYGRKHFLELVSIFTSDPVFKVLHGRKELGTVDQLTFIRHREEDPTTLSMSGRSWVVTALDWKRREAFVIPSQERGKSQWLGSRMGMSYRIARAIHGLLTDTKISDIWSNRAIQALQSLREDYGFLHTGDDVILHNKKSNEVRWFTFAGYLVNTVIANAARSLGGAEISNDDFLVKNTGAADWYAIVDRVKNTSVVDLMASFIISNDFIEKLKFFECLPKPLIDDMLRGRMLDREQIEASIGRKIKVTEEYS